MIRQARDAGPHPDAVKRVKNEIIATSGGMLAPMWEARTEHNLNVCHEPQLGLARSVCLGDICTWLRTRPKTRLGRLIGNEFAKSLEKDWT
jgi:hypothetical protein